MLPIDPDYGGFAEASTGQVEHSDVRRGSIVSPSGVLTAVSGCPAAAKACCLDAQLRRCG